MLNTIRKINSGELYIPKYRIKRNLTLSWYLQLAAIQQNLNSKKLDISDKFFEVELELPKTQYE